MSDFGIFLDFCFGTFSSFSESESFERVDCNLEEAFLSLALSNLLLFSLPELLLLPSLPPLPDLSDCCLLPPDFSLLSDPPVPESDTDPDLFSDLECLEDDLDLALDPDLESALDPDLDLEPDLDDGSLNMNPRRSWIEFWI